MQKAIKVIASLCALILIVIFTIGLPERRSDSITPQSIILGSDATALKDPMRISSFNVRCVCAERDPLDNWYQGRAERAATYLADQSVDLVGMQEFETGHAGSLFGTSTKPGLLGKDWDYYASPYFLALNAIAWHTERYTRTAAGFAILPFGLPSSDRTSGFSPRGLTWVQLLDKQTRKRFYMFNTHLDYRGGGTDVNGGTYEQTRAEQVNQVLKIVRNTNTAGLPMVLTGDFNSTDAERAYAAVKDSGLFSDARVLAQLLVNDGLNTYSGYKLPVKGNAIDFVFVSPTSLVSKYLAFTDTYAGRYPSDHFPLIVDVELK